LDAELKMADGVVSQLFDCRIIAAAVGPDLPAPTGLDRRCPWYQGDQLQFEDLGDIFDVTFNSGAKTGHVLQALSPIDQSDRERRLQRT